MNKKPTNNTASEALKSMYSYWEYDNAPEFKQVVNSIDWNKKDGKWGEYQTDGNNACEGKVFIPDLSHMEGKTICEVMQYVQKEYTGKYRFPGLEYQQWLYENPGKIPEELKDTSKWFYFPGSSFCGSGGSWGVPYGNLKGSGWSRHGDWLGFDWGSDHRVVLLGK